MMSSMDILITGDVLRPNPQKKNIEWLYRMVRHQLEAMTGKMPVLDSEPKAHEQMLGVPEWVSCEDDRISRYYPPKDFIHMAFEGPRGWFNNGIGVKVEFAIHPIRFMSDLLIGVRTNAIPLEKLKRFGVHDYDIRIQAECVRSYYERRGLDSFPPHSIMIVGQTEFDRSVIVDGVVKRLIDYYTMIKLLAVQAQSRGGKVILKPHPDNVGGLQELRAALMSDGFGDSITVFDTEQNTYQLLSTPGIETVIGLNSSVLLEATYFGKASIPLIPVWWRDMCGFAPSVAFSTPFLSELVTPWTKSGVVINLSVPDRPNHMRETLDAWWAYEIGKKV